MKWIEKWKESKEKQKAKDIEYCRQHPIGWKIGLAVFTFGFGLLIVFMTLDGAYPLSIIAFGFAVWMAWQYIKIYREAFPKGKVTL